MSERREDIMAETREYRGVPSPSTLSRLTWSAVFGGAAVTVVTAMLLILLGMAIGLFAIDPATDENPFGGLGIGSAIWWVLSWIVALFFGGWITARFAGLQRKFDGALHGLVTWSVTFLASLILLTNIVGAVISGTFGVIGTVLSAAGEMVQAVPEVAEVVTGEEEPVQRVIEEARQVIEQARKRGGEMAVNEITTTIREIFRQPEITDADRQRLFSLITKYTDMGEQEARSTVNRWADSYEQARQRLQDVREQLPATAEQIADALARAALWSFFALLLGAIAAGLGGMSGRVKGEVEI
jgi:hypothetical protein